MDAYAGALGAALITGLASIFATWAVMRDNGRRRRLDTRNYVDERERRWREYHDEQFEKMTERLADLESRESLSRSLVDKIQLQYRTLLAELEVERMRVMEKDRQLSELSARVVGLENERDELRLEVVERQREIDELRRRLDELTLRVSKGELHDFHN